MFRLKNFDLDKGTEVFKALSDMSRVRILNLIFHNQEMCISDLELILDFTQTKTSRHLIYLKNSGLLKYRKNDQWVYYYLNETYSEFIAQILDSFKKDPVLQKDLNEYRTLYSNNELAIRKLHNKQKIYRLPELE